MRWVTASLLVATMVIWTAEAKAAERPLANQRAAAFVKEIGKGWHLRGDIRFSPPPNAASQPVPAAAVVDRKFDAAPFYLLRTRYQFEAWLRSNAATERPVNFHGLTASVSGETFSRSVADNSP